MNPIVKLVDKYVTWHLTQEDLKRIEEVDLIDGTGSGSEVILNRMCIMQAVNMVTVAHTFYGKPVDPADPVYGDNPICVSPSIASACVLVNDEFSKEERERLKELVPFILNTRPVVRREYKNLGLVYKPASDPQYYKAERKRKRMLQSIRYTRKDGKNIYRSVEEIIEIIKEAADLYRSDVEKVPGDAEAS